MTKAARSQGVKQNYYPPLQAVINVIKKRKKTRVRVKIKNRAISGWVFILHSKHLLLQVPSSCRVEIFIRMCTKRLSHKVRNSKVLLCIELWSVKVFDQLRTITRVSSYCNSQIWCTLLFCYGVTYFYLAVEWLVSRRAFRSNIRSSDVC